MRISDCSSDVCSSDLKGDLGIPNKVRIASVAQETPSLPDPALDFVLSGDVEVHAAIQAEANAFANEDWEAVAEAHHRLEELNGYDASARARSEEHTSELQSLMRISYAVFCLKKKTIHIMNYTKRYKHTR